MGLLGYSTLYLEAMEAKGRRPETLRAYARDLAALVGHLGDVAPEAVTPEALEGFLDQLASEGKATSSIVRARDVIRAFWGWMRAEGVVQANPTEALSHGPHLDRVDRPRSNPERASTHEIAAVLAHLNAGDDRLVTSLVASTGLAASDLLALRAQDVTFMNDRHPEMPGGVAILTTRQAHSERLVVVAEPDIVRALQIQVSRKEPTEPLFHVPMRTLQHRFRQAAKTAGLPDLTLRNVRRTGGSAVLPTLRQRRV